MKQFASANGRMYRRTIVSATVLIVSIILILSFVLYLNFERIGVRLVSDAKLTTLSQISYSADYMNNTVKNFASTFYVDKDNSNAPLMYGKEENFDYIVKQMKIIDTIANGSPYIQSVYVYNGGLERFYSTRGPMLNDARDFADQDVVGIIDSGQLTADKRFQPILRKVPMNAFSKDNSYFYNVFTYFLYDFFDDNKKIKGAVIINVNVDYLAQMVNTLNAKTTSTPSEIYIMNEEGKLFGGANATYEWSDPSEAEETFLRKAKSEQTKSGYYVDRRDGEKVLVTYAQSEKTGWRFVDITPYGQVIKDIERMKERTVYVCLIILAVGFLLAYLLARFLYAPLRSFIGKIAKLSGISEHETGPDELRFLSEVFTDSVEKAKAGEALKRENKFKMKQEALRGLLQQDNAGMPRLKQVLDQFGVPINPDAPHILFIVQIDDLADFNRKFSAADQQLFRFAIGNVACEAAMKSFQQPAVVMDDNPLAIVMQAAGPADKIFGKLTDALKQVQSWSEQHLHVSLSMAMSYVSGNMSELAQSYKEALNVSKFRLVYGHRSILSPESLNKVKSDGFIPPASLEHQLEDQLTLGKRDEAIETYDHIIGYISEYSVDVITTYTLHLAYLMYRKMNEIDLKDHSSDSLDYNGMTRQILATETLDRLNDKFVGLIKLITDSVGQTRYVRKHALAEKVLGIVEANYTDKSLCQEGIAGTINISKDYLGKIFRDAYGKSIAEFITELRLNKAGELLVAGEMNVTELLEEIGWENKNYFYTQFKAKFGMTTSEYRVKNKAAASDSKKK